MDVRRFDGTTERHEGPLHELLEKAREELGDPEVESVRIFKPKLRGRMAKGKRPPNPNSLGRESLEG